MPEFRVFFWPGLALARLGYTLALTGGLHA